MTYPVNNQNLVISTDLSAGHKPLCPSNGKIIKNLPKIGSQVGGVGSSYSTSAWSIMFSGGVFGVFKHNLFMFDMFVGIYTRGL